MLCLIQARMSSKRLPGKSLLYLNKKKLLSHVIENVKKSKDIKKIIVVCSSSKSDDKLSNFCKNKSVSVFRGEQNNVASRFFYVLKNTKFKSFVRINGDSPIIDYKLINIITKKFNSKKHDICTNVLKRTFPKGQSVEVISKNFYIKNFNKIKSKSDLEHVTAYFYKNKKKFKIFNINSKKNFSNINLSVDTLQDFERISKLMKKNKTKHCSWITYCLEYIKYFHNEKN